MALGPVPITDTRFYFRPVSRELVTLLRELQVSDWDRPTVAGSWLVRDVVAHLLDTSLRRLSFHRDHHQPPTPESPPAGDREFVAFINGLNRQWVVAARRMSRRVLTDLYDAVSLDLAAFMESRALDSAALFPVSWAGEHASAGWFDIGREFTEQWHHQMQIRDAVGAPSLGNPEWLRAFLSIAVRVLPHAFRHATAAEDTTVTIEITGASGSLWSLLRERSAWSLWSGPADVPTTAIRLSDDAAWRLLFNGLSREEGSKRVSVTGDLSLVPPFLDARSVIV
jgi:mycothiol maleylpyruvate isomerase-like protein